jgi:DNA-binding GntR family transcriptional regulator
MRGDASTVQTAEKQAALLARLAQEARLVRMAVEDGQPALPALADRLEQALEQAVDADAPAEAGAAQGALHEVLTELHTAGFIVQAELSQMEVDGLLGATYWPVLTATVSRGAVA